MLSIRWAHIGQDAHVITVETREDAERIAQRIGATERTRFGWRLARPRYSTIIELFGRPEVHPDARKDAQSTIARQGHRGHRQENHLAVASVALIGAQVRRVAAGAAVRRVLGTRR